MYSKNRLNIYKFISQLLWDELIPIETIEKINNDSLFWDEFVKIASSHLLLPILFTKLNNPVYDKLKRTNSTDELS